MSHCYQLENSGKNILKTQGPDASQGQLCKQSFLRMVVSDLPWPYFSAHLSYWRSTVNMMPIGDKYKYEKRKKMYHAKTNHNKVGVAVLISDKRLLSLVNIYSLRFKYYAFNQFLSIERKTIQEFPTWLSSNKPDSYPWGFGFNPWPCSVG